MPHLTRSIDIAASPADVWRVYADYGRVDVWHPYFESAELVDPSTPSGVGAARDCSFGPRAVIRETVREWNEDGYMEIGIEFLKGPPSPMRNLVASVSVGDGAEAGTSTLTLALDYDVAWNPVGPVIDRLMIQPMYLDVFDNMLAASKRYVETGQPSEQLALRGSGRKLD